MTMLQAREFRLFIDAMTDKAEEMRVSVAIPVTGN